MKESVRKGGDDRKIGRLRRFGEKTGESGQSSVGSRPDGILEADIDDDDDDGDDNDQ